MNKGNRLKTLVTAVAAWTLALTGTARAAVTETSTAAIADTRAGVLKEILPDSCSYELDDESVLKIKLSADIDGTVNLPADLSDLDFVLNGHSIFGTSGADAAEGVAATAGQPAVVIGKGTYVTFTGPGTVAGGNGGDGDPFGRGAPAVVDADGVKIENPSVTEGTTVAFIDGKDGVKPGEGGEGGEDGDEEGEVPAAEAYRITATVCNPGETTVRMTTEIPFKDGVDEAAIERWVKAGNLKVRASATLGRLAKTAPRAVKWPDCVSVTCAEKTATVVFLVAKPGKTAGFYQLTDDEAGEEGVQLWKGGPYFAECNIGATSPEEYGWYFWWGDTEGYVRNADDTGWVSAKDGTTTIEFSDSDAKAGQNMFKSNAKLRSEGWIDESGNLTLTHDAARAHLGGDWRMPTEAEIQALINNTTTTWTDNWNGTGVAGGIVTGKGEYADQSIFLPAAGWGADSSLNLAGGLGLYWSSTHSGSFDAGGLIFDSSVFDPNSGHSLSHGFPVRPVRDAE